MALVFDVHKLDGFTNQERAEFYNLLQVGTEVLNSMEFKEAILNFTWTRYYRVWFRKYSEVMTRFHDTDDSNTLVYSKLMSGIDTLNPAEDKDIDLFLSLYYKSHNVIGYTNPSENTIYVNRKYFVPNLKSSKGKSDIINNVVHEYMHKVGYDHSFFNNSSRPYSVPYAVGDIAGRLSYKLLTK